MLKPTVDQLFNQLSSLVSQPGDAKNIQDKFFGIHDTLEKNDSLIKKLQETSKSIKQSIHEVNCTLSKTSDEMKNLAALHARIQEVSTDFNATISDFHQSVNETTRIVQSICPQDVNGTSATPIHVPSAFYVNLHEQLSLHAQTLEYRIEHLERTIAYYQQSSSSASSTSDETQAKLIESTLRIHHQLYRQLAISLTNIQVRILQNQGVQDFSKQQY